MHSFDHKTTIDAHMTEIRAFHPWTWFIAYSMDKNSDTSSITTREN